MVKCKIGKKGEKCHNMERYMYICRKASIMVL